MSEKMNDSYLLGIETSCDETAAAVVKNGRIVLSNIISSQLDTHKKYGGVVPEIASRKHIEAIGWVVGDAMRQAGMSFGALEGVAVTYGPGLVGALLTGLSYAKGLAFAIGKPLVGVHHIEAHICANYIAGEEGAAVEAGAETPDSPGLAPPYVCLVVSGGHTTLVHVPDYGVYRVLGQTRDDAAGEAYDKVARALGLGYPGGPEIDRLAGLGDENAIAFPRAFLEEGSLDFSFSGLKSAVQNAVNRASVAGSPVNAADFAASFQKALVDVLVSKTMLAARRLGAERVALAGGVSCNTALRRALAAACRQEGVRLYAPKAVYCTDNAAMVAVCGHDRLKRGCIGSLELNALPQLSLE